MYAGLGDGEAEVKPIFEDDNPTAPSQARPAKPKSRNRRSSNGDGNDSVKRRCVSTACIACRRRKSKCDGNTPACAACSSVYGTECVYDPHSDHRRKGVYKKDIDSLKTRNSTLHTLVQAILNYPEEEIPDLITQIRSGHDLDDVAQSVRRKEEPAECKEEEALSPLSNYPSAEASTFETELSGKMGRLRLEDGSVRYIGGTSNLIYLSSDPEEADGVMGPSIVEQYQQHENPITSWTSVTSDPDLIMHLVNMYFTWHYTFFTTLSKHLFFRDFLLGRPPPNVRRKTEYCTPLLVNAILALGCHFTSSAGAREVPDDSATAGDHFFREAKRLLMANDEHENSKLTTVQGLALMSVREAGCGREVKGWVYSGMSFRMACDLGLNVNSGGLSASKDSTHDEAEEDARRITFWGCYLFDKCWSNYLGRLPHLQLAHITAPKFDVLPNEDADTWQPCTDSGFSNAHAQPSRTRAVALRISALCEISDDVMAMFYNPSQMDKVVGKQAELKKLGDIHSRLEAWKRDLPKELEPKEGGLASVLVMHMYYQLLHIHLFRPFLRYNALTSPLPASVSPRKLCTEAATTISKLLRLYKRSYGLRQVCNIVVYIAHSACTIHLLNLPDKNAKRDIIHGLKALEEIGEGWLCARRTLCMLSMLAKRWRVELPDEAMTVLARTDNRFRAWGLDAPSPRTQAASPPQPFQPDPELRSQSQPTTQPSRAMSIQTQGLNIGTATDKISFIHNFQLPPRLPKGLRYERSQQQARRQHPYRSVPQQQHSRQYSTSSMSSEKLRRPSSFSFHSFPPPQSVTDTNISIDGTSPSTSMNIFGSVDNLSGDSTSGPPNPQEWSFRDQSQLATGFENWGMGMDTSEDGGAPWMSDGFGPAQVDGEMTGSGLTIGPGDTAVDGMDGMDAGGGDLAHSHADTGTAGLLGGYAMANGINAEAINVDASVMDDRFLGMNCGYNEEEWYQ